MVALGAGTQACFVASGEGRAKENSYADVISGVIFTGNAYGTVFSTYNSRNRGRFFQGNPLFGESWQKSSRPLRLDSPHAIPRHRFQPAAMEPAPCRAGPPPHVHRPDTHRPGPPPGRDRTGRTGAAGIAPRRSGGGAGRGDGRPAAPAGPAPPGAGRGLYPPPAAGRSGGRIRRRGADLAPRADEPSTCPTAPGARSASMAAC